MIKNKQECLNTIIKYIKTFKNTVIVPAFSCALHFKSESFVWLLLVKRLVNVGV